MSNVLLPNLRQVLRRSTGIPDGTTRKAVANLEDWAIELITRLAALTPSSSVTLPIAESDVTGLVTDLAAKVPTSRVLTTTAPIKIDGGASADLAANRTLSIDTFSTSVKGAVPAPGSTSGAVLTDDGTWQALNAGAPALILGTGYDGPLNFDGSATVLGIVPSGNVYILTRSINPTNMTVGTGVTVKAAGYAIVGTGTLTLTGTAKISNSGSDAPGSPSRAGGAGAPAGDLPGGMAGGDGSLAFNAPAVGVDSSSAPAWGTTSAAAGGTSAGASGATGGELCGGGGGYGGDGAGHPGATGGKCTLSTTSGSALLPIYGLLTGMSQSSPPARYTTGAGGGGGNGNGDTGGGSVTLEGGGGGGGGGWLTVLFKQITGSGSLEAKGGAGGLAANSGGSTSNRRAGGGGGGGSGGTIVVGKFNGSFPTCTVTGGAGAAGGTAAGSSLPGGAGGNGGVGQVHQLTLASGVGTGSASSSLPDGDYGDIVVSGSTTAMTIDTGVVSTTKMGVDVTTAGKALLTGANAAAQRTSLGLGTLATQSSVATTDIASVTTARILGRTTAGTGTAEQLTGTQATALLDTVTTSVKGLAPTLPNDATKYLDGTGAYSVPAGSGGGGSSAGSYSLLAAPVTFSGVANTETVVMSYSAPANTLSAGMTFHYSLAGGRTGATSAVATVRVRIGTSTLTGAIVFANGNTATTNPGGWRFEGTFVITATGASGVAWGEGWAGINLAGGSVAYGPNNRNGVVIDTTVANLVEVTLVSGDAANTYTPIQAALWGGALGSAGSGYIYNTKTTDSFNRVNSTTSLGTTDGTSSLDPLTWVQNRGTWGINTNTAYVSSTGAGTQLNNATVSLAAGTRTQFVQATVTTLPTQNSTSVGIVLGLVDANNFYYLQCNRSSGGVYSYALARYLAGAGSTLLSIANVPVANDVIRLERVQYGIISVFINGTLVGSAFDGVIPNGVKVGLLDITTGGSVSGGRLDVFSAGTIS